MDNLIFSDTLYDSSKNIIYCGTEEYVIIAARKDSRYLYDAINSEDYIEINSNAYTASCNWHKDSNFAWMFYDNLNIGHATENLIFIKLLRGVVEKIFAIRNTILVHKPNSINIDVQNDILLRNLIISVINHLKICINSKYDQPEVHKRRPFLYCCKLIKEFAAYLFFPYLLRLLRPRFKFSSREKRLFISFAGNHERMLKPFLKNHSFDNFLIVSVIGPNLPERQHLLSSNTLFVDSFINLDIINKFIIYKHILNRSLSDKISLKKISSKFTIDGLNYFEAIESSLENFIYDSFPKVVRYYKLSTEMIDQLNPSILVFGNDSCQRARVLVCVANSVGIPSLVIQHGVIASKELYYPTSSCMAVWGAKSKNMLISNGVNPSAIAVTGSLVYDLSKASLCNHLIKRQVTIISSPPPTGFERSNIFDFIDIIIKINTRFKNVEIVIKIHPSEGIERYAYYFKYFGLKARIVEKCDLEQLIKESCVVVSVYSTVIIDCVLLDTPVILLDTVYPEDTGFKNVDILSHASSSEDIISLLDILLLEGHSNTIPADLKRDFINNYCNCSGAVAIDNVENIITKLMSSRRNDLVIE